MTSMGFQWQPGKDIPYGQQGKPAVTPTQSPAKLLSLRLPSREVPQTVAPLSLLQGQGSQGMGAGLPQFLTLLSHLLRDPNNAIAGGGGFLGEDRDPIGGHGTQRMNVPGLQVPGQGSPMRMSPTTPSIPTPRFTIGDGQPGDLFQSGPMTEAPPLF